MLLKVAMQHTSAVSDNPLTVVFKLWCLFIKYKFEYNTEQKKKIKVMSEEFVVNLSKVIESKQYLIIKIRSHC